MLSASPSASPPQPAALRKETRFVTITDAIEVVQSFAETQLRRARTQQKPSRSASISDDHSSALESDDVASGSSSSSTAGTTTTTSTSSLSPSSQNVVVLECESAPECKWFVRLSFIKSEQKWKISSMNTTHHRTNCSEMKPASSSESPAVSGGYASASSVLNIGAGPFQRMMQEEEPMPASATNSAALLSSATDPNSLASAATAGASGSQLFLGMMFMSWKEAIATIRALALQMGRRVVAEKPAEMLFQGRSITVRRAVCQNHRNSNCEWMVVLEENQMGSEQYTVLSIHLLHSKECLETCNFSARKKESSQAMKSASHSAGATAAARAGAHHGVEPFPSNGNQMLGANNPSGSLLVDDISKYQLTHEMRWSTGKEATKAISDFTLVVQRKRSKLCKKNNGGSNKKYVCSDEACLWFVQLVRGWKSKNWKISAMNLKHSESCAGAPKPTARQLAEMRFFRQAVVTHSKASGKLLTDTFLLNSETGIHIPRGMAYRAQRLVVATSTDDLTESYKFIPSLLDSFAKKNPGSTVLHERNEQGHFVRAFLMPNAMSLALLCMQPVYGIKLISYDNVSYNGVLALLIGRDGDLQNQVLAFALMPNSEMEHMKWFLSLCKTGGARFDGNPVYCSHNQNGLLRALAHEARNAKIMFCVRSLIEEINRDKNIPSLGALEDLIWSLQSQETEEKFVRTLSQLEGLNAPAAAFIRAVHPKNWAYYANSSSIRLYKWASTNAEEAIAGSDVQFSDEAPFDLMYTFLAFLMDSVFKKSQLANKLIAENPLLTPGADALYRKEFQEASAYTVRLCDEQVAFTWRTGARPKITHRVDLSERKCTCGQMMQVGIPCCHFIAVSLHFASEAALMEGFDAIYRAASYAEVNRNLRIEIPAAEDLYKDSTMLPAVSLKGTKHKKRARSTTANESEESGELTGNDSNGNAGNGSESGSSSSNSSLGMPHAKAPRLEFDADVVTGLTELV